MKNSDFSLLSGNMFVAASFPATGRAGWICMAIGLVWLFTAIHHFSRGD